MGCGSEETIARYAVPKEESRTPPPVTSDATPATRLTAWFFKLDGPQETVTAVEPEFTALVESVRFEGGKPRWILPDGWTESSGSQMRFATLKVESTKPPLEVSVIPLPVFGNDIAEYLRQNVDRWRAQVGLPPSSGADWLEIARSAGEIRESDAGEIPVTFVDLKGKTEQFDPARMLGAMLIPTTDAKAIRQPSPPAETPPPAPAALTFDTPEGWSAGKASSMRAASFVVTDGDRQVDISAIVAGGNELDNVNRWRQQVGLEPVSEEDLKSTARAIQVNGESAPLFELAGEEETILAVIVPRGSLSWFFKLMGDPELAAREKANFEAWVTSIKFP